MINNALLQNKKHIVAWLLVLVYLWVVAVITVNIHILIINAGVPYPGDHFHPPKYIGFIGGGIQLCGMYWLYQRLKDRFMSHGVYIKILMLFVLMAALMELILRLPLTAGYVVDKHFLFVWVSQYLPKIVLLLIACVLVDLACLIKRSHWYINVLFVSMFFIYSFLEIRFISPLITYEIDKILQFINPPNLKHVLHLPYGWQTNVIASVFFIEPILSYFCIAWLIWDKLYGNLILKSVLLVVVILILNKELVKFITFMTYTDLPFWKALFSIGQFTIEWVFSGIMIAILCNSMKKGCRLFGSTKT